MNRKKKKKMEKIINGNNKAKILKNQTKSNGKKILKKPFVENVENDNTRNIILHGSLKKTKIKIDHENSINITNTSNITLMWNTNGWIRIFLGTDRSDLTCEDPNKMMHITAESKTEDIVKDMALPDGYTIWVSCRAWMACGD